MTESDLKKYRQYLRARTLALAALEEYEPRVYGARTTRITPLPASRAVDSDRLAFTVERLDKLRERVERLNNLVEEAEELVLYVATLLDTYTERDVLIYRYYMGLSVSDTAKRMGCSRRSIYNYRADILDKIKNITYIIPI